MGFLRMGITSADLNIVDTRLGTKESIMIVMKGGRWSCEMVSSMGPHGQIPEQ